MIDGIKQALLRRKPEEVRVQHHNEGALVLTYRLVEACDDCLVVEEKHSAKAIVILPYANLRRIELVSDRG